MTNEAQSFLASGQKQSGGLDELRHLVRAAFEQARHHGKPDWREMTSAVLKNRLLNMTGKEFSERHYGSTSFINVVRKIPDLVEVVDESPPFHIRLKEAARAPSDSAITLANQEASTATPITTGSRKEGDWKGLRVREDLWRSVIDYKSGSMYVLDAETGRARARLPSDTDRPLLPTTKHEDVISWRREFISLLTVDKTVQTELDRWADRDGRMADLPRPLRGRWADFVKRRVVERLQTWFRSNQLAVPGDLLVTADVSNPESSEQTDRVVQTQQLRDLIARAANEMTYEELTSVSLPASVVIRLQRGRGSHA